MQRLDAQTAAHRDQLTEERRKRVQAEELLRQRMQEANERIAELTRANEAATQSAAARLAAERAAERAAMEAKHNHVSFFFCLLNAR